MPLPKTIIVDSIDAYIGELGTLSASSTVQLWYRGTSSSSHALRSSLYRHPTKTDIDDLLALEKRLINRFKQRSVPYTTRYLRDDWEYLFLMQHFGVPTRLLDWSENPFIALYFAVAFGITVQPPTGGPAGPPDASVWVLNPELWNRYALRHLSFHGDVLATDDTEMSGYTPQSESISNARMTAAEPVAMYGIHNSTRIVAQRGVFVIFGIDLKPMEETYIANNYPVESLVQLVVPAASVPSVMRSLILMGITDSVVFPDLDGLSREIKRAFGFVV
jgi:hypothetical protein